MKTIYRELIKGRMLYWSYDEAGNPVTLLGAHAEREVMHHHARLITVRSEADLPTKTRTADRIDGYDRDDLGESPDY